MPEQVRRSVESDYRNGNLRILLSSNTIGQGLNFPIKNLIIYSLQIGIYKNENGEDKPKYIQKRDFWNIIGRAGRAGKETEGQIIYVINSYNDKINYKKFIDKSNIENADSLIFKVLNALTLNRINDTKFDKYLSILSETYLLDLLTEEIIGTDYEEVIEKIINNSLFKVQVDNRKLDIQPLKQGFKKIFKSFEEDEITAEQSRTYRITGFSFKSNKVIDNFIDENFEELTNVAKKDDYLKVLKLFLKLLSDSDIDELSDNKLDKLSIAPTEYFEIIKNWIAGEPIENLITIWKQDTQKDISDFHILISKGLYYLYPWGLSSFLIILSHKLSIKFKELPENIKALPSYLKYGLNNSTSCLARSLGVKSR
ncbi:MAG TPA: hypothetical protein ENK99_04210, partial [Campylobacterales bacterium]|nr:hypothetical protein [Campylobacterales bacterium]